MSDYRAEDPSHSIDDTWFCAQEALDGSPARIRARRNLNDVAGSPSYPDLFLIRWRYEPALLGQPSEDEVERMETFERTVIDELEMDWLVIFFCVLTHEGRHEWMGYCGDVDEAVDRLNQALEGDTPYPIELVSAADPEWLEYREFTRE